MNLWIRAVPPLTLLLSTGCGEGANTLPASDSSVATDVASAEVPSVKTSCAEWAKSQTGSGVPAAPPGKLAGQRDALVAAGGGLTAVGTKYYASYFSPKFAASASKRVIVNLHGTGGAPEAEWDQFKNSLAIDEHGWGFLGLKYYDETTGFYDKDETIYANLGKMIRETQGKCDLGGAKFFVFGFSRGSAKTFAMAYLDNKGDRLFSGYASSSGGAWQQPSGCAWKDTAGTCAWEAKAPLFPNPKCALIDAGAPCLCAPSEFTTTESPKTGDGKPEFANTIVSAGDKIAYAGSKFWLYCGERDYHANSRQCSEMEMSKVFVESFGGKVVELYRAGADVGCTPWTGTDCIASPDTKCGHGSLKNQAAAVKNMWAFFESE